MQQTPSTDPSPRPSYSVSTHALSSPSLGPTPSPPVSVSAPWLPSPQGAEVGVAAALPPASARLTSGSNFLVLVQGPSK